LFCGLFSLHRLTSPQITLLQKFHYRQDQSEVSTFSGWIFLAVVGYTLTVSPIRPITDRPSLFLISLTLCIVPLSYDWDTAALVTGYKGFNQLITEKIRIGEVSVYIPVGVAILVAAKGLQQTDPLTILVTVYQPLLPFALHGILGEHFTYVWPSNSSLVHCYFEASSFRTLSSELRTLDYSFARPSRDTWRIQGSFD
jgi:hypothetical protein